MAYPRKIFKLFPLRELAVEEEEDILVAHIAVLPYHFLHFFVEMGLRQVASDSHIVDILAQPVVDLQLPSNEDT